MNNMINKEWLVNARSNESTDHTVEDMLCRAGNYNEVEIDSDGSVAADDRWLNQDRIDELCARVDLGA